MYKDEYGVEYSDDRTELVRCPESFSGEYIIPDSVVYIEEDAFADCEGLTSIEIPESVRVIGDGAFDGCTGLTSINIPKRLGALGSSTFANCTGLKSVVIPDNIKYLEWGVFNGCEALESVKLPDNLEFIDEYCFNGCAFKSIYIPDDTFLEYCVFCNCENLEEIHLPLNMSKISNGMFKDCPCLRTIDIPAIVKTIEEEVFDGCSMKSITLRNPHPEDMSVSKDFAVSSRRGCTLFVPAEALEAYKKHPLFSTFKDIQPLQEA